MRRTILILLASMALIATGVVAGNAAGGSGVVASPPRIAFLANGINPADAVAAGGIAGQLGAPLFTTGPAALESAARLGLIAYEPVLVIVLGGPVAIAESVVNEVAAALGLAVTTAEAPTDGIVRVAGETRFDTAAAVATLLETYNPAYLPVDATALGAVEASAADNAGLLDGLDASAFALADRACDSGEVVTGIGANGTPTCTRDIQRPRPVTDIVTDFVPLVPSGLLTVNRTIGRTQIQNVGSSPDGASAILDVDLGDGAAGNLELTTFELCLGSGGDSISNVSLFASEITSATTLFSHNATETFANNTCTEIVLPGRYILDTGVRPTIVVEIDDKTSVEIRAIRLTWTPTTDALQREP